MQIPVISGVVTDSSAEFRTPEEWRPVLGYEGLYSVSSLGRVRGEARLVAHMKQGKMLRQRIVKARINKQTGYLAVNLSRDASRRTFTVHSLVAAAFIGPRPFGMEVAHGDGNPTNAMLSNLRYATPSENVRDKEIHGTILKGERAPRAKLTNAEVRSLRSDKRLLREIAADYGIAVPTACMLRKGVYYADAK